MIAIIGAMQVEVDAICALMEQVERHTIHHTDFYTGTLAQRKVVVMRSGVGKGNAAMNTAILLQHFPVDQIINIGTAGGLLAEQKVLDVVISDYVVQHDYDTSALDGPAGLGLRFQASAALIEKAKALLASDAYQVYVGEVVSGDQFISDVNQLETLKAHFPNAICAEMEAGAIAQVASHFQVDFVVIRSLSDVALNPDSHLDCPVYVAQASERSAHFVKQYVGLA
ncbi:MAG: 5'-methylthioadenosine/adenosylhomocysteine nucleosidase [Erysipelotrichaceae bacterium]